MTPLAPATRTRPRDPDYSSISISGWSPWRKYVATNSSGSSGEALSKRRILAPAGS
jgi:hypothetical protein